MQDYRDRWCQFLSAALTGDLAGRTLPPLDEPQAIRRAASFAEREIGELQARDKKHAFDQPEKGYRG